MAKLSRSEIEQRIKEKANFYREISNDTLFVGRVTAMIKLEALKWVLKLFKDFK